MCFIEDVINQLINDELSNLVIFVDEVPLITSSRPYVKWHFKNEINQSNTLDKHKRNVTLLSAICREGTLL